MYCEGALTRVVTRVDRYAEEEVMWDVYTLSEVRFPHATHLAFIEGVSPFWGFMGAKLQVDNNALVDGPFYLIKEQLSPISKVPCRASDVVLGRPHTTPKNATAMHLVLWMYNALYAK